jgi:hypothetical protein
MYVIAQLARNKLQLFLLFSEDINVPRLFNMTFYDKLNYKGGQVGGEKVKLFTSQSNNSVFSA